MLGSDVWGGYAIRLGIRLVWGGVKVWRTLVSVWLGGPFSASGSCNGSWGKTGMLGGCVTVAGSYWIWKCYWHLDGLGLWRVASEGVEGYMDEGDLAWNHKYRLLGIAGYIRYQSCRYFWHVQLIIVPGWLNSVVVSVVSAGGAP